MTAEQTRLWEIVYSDIRGRIERGELMPGEQIPAEHELAEQHGVSRHTVRAGLMRLQQDGLVTEGRGRLGRTVREHRPLKWVLTTFERGDRRDDPTTGRDDWAQGVVEQGRTPRQVVTVTIEHASEDIARYLEIPQGDLVVRRHRVRLVDNQPYQLATSWFPEAVARNTPLMEERDITMPGGIMHAIGHPQSHIRDEITVRMPTPSEAELLDLPMGSPVGQHARIGIGAEGIPVRVMITVFPGNRQYLVYELEV